MTVIEKIDYLIKYLDLSERKFSKVYRIRKNIIKKWRLGQAIPKPENVKYLCEQFNLSVQDFLDDNSSINVQGCYADEHKCVGQISPNPVEGISEDYPVEDNFRYEEKD